MASTGPCEYCTVKAPAFLAPPESEQTHFVCRTCLQLLKNPATALPLIRGNLSIKLRGVIPEGRLTKMMDTFMGELSKLAPRN